MILSFKINISFLITGVYFYVVILGSRNIFSIVSLKFFDLSWETLILLFLHLPRIIFLFIKIAFYDKIHRKLFKNIYYFIFILI